jgi:trans-aconitate methyltransferase
VFAARANRAFLARAVGYLARDAGICQFLDIGCGIPAPGSTHEIAQSITPSSRVVYVDNDPLVLAHARALLGSGPVGSTDYVDADLRDPGLIVAEAAWTLDLTRPVAILLLLILDLIPDDDDPYAIVARLVDAVSPGSYLVLSHPASDLEPVAAANATRRYNKLVSTPQTRRSHAGVSRFFAGLDVIAPGVVQLHQWHPGPGTFIPEGVASAHGGVARKPVPCD